MSRIRRSLNHGPVVGGGRDRGLHSSSRLGSHQSYIRCLLRSNLGFGCRVPDNPNEIFLLNRRSEIENAFVNKCQIFKVDLFDALLDPKEGVVEEVRVSVAEYP